MQEWKRVIAVRQQLLEKLGASGYQLHKSAILSELAVEYRRDGKPDQAILAEEECCRPGSKD